MNPSRVPEVGSISASILARGNPTSIPQTTVLQAQVEGCVGGFVTEATRVQTLAALFGAGMAYRLTRVGVVGSGLLGNSVLTRAASVGLGLAGESAVFTGINRGFNHLNHVGNRQSFGEEWVHSTVTLGALKGFGVLGQGQNLFVRHLFSDVGMVSGHQLAYGLGLQARPEGTLAEQFLQVEALNWQMAAGMSLTHRLAPGLSAVERGLDLPLRAPAPASGSSPETLSPALAGAGASGGGRSSALEDGGNWMRKPSILAMAGEGNGAGNGIELGSSPTAPEVIFETPPLSRSEGSGSSPQASEAPAALASSPPPLDLSRARYHLPETEYFEGLQGSLSFEKLVGYAQSVRRAHLVGPNLRNALHTPLSGPLEYSPYGAALVEHLRENPALVHTLTGKWERALVASPGTAILGLGSADIGGDHLLMAEAADAIMQGKSKYFLWTAGVSATPLCIRSHLTPSQLRALEAIPNRRQREDMARAWRAEAFAETVRSLSPNFGFINIEDAQGKDLPLIFGVLESLRGNTAIWSDDMQGTGVITAAAMLSWAELTGRLDSETRMPGVRGIIFGAGAGAMGVYNELVHHGVLPENILVTDSKGPLHGGRYDVEGDPFKRRMREGIPEGTTVEDFARGADFIINLGVKETLTDNLAWAENLTRSLAFQPFVGPMTNPEPGISPEMLRQVRADAFYGSGNQIYENPVNNFTAFGYIGAGAMMAKAGEISPAMTVAAARGIFEVAKLGPPEEARGRLPEDRREFGRFWLVPQPDDMRLIAAEAGAVAKAAARDGLAILLGANPDPAALARFERDIDDQVSFRHWMVQSIRSGSADGGPIYLASRHSRSYAPFSLKPEGQPVYEVAPEIHRDYFEHFALQMGLKPERWEHLLTPEGELKPTALTEALLPLRPATVSDTPEAAVAARELQLITQLSTLSPSLGLALALRRGRVRPENLAARPTVFHREPVLRTVLQLIPEARQEIETSFEGITPIH